VFAYASTAPRCRSRSPAATWWWRAGHTSDGGNRGSEHRACALADWSRTSWEPTNLQTWQRCEDVALYLLEKMGDTLGLGLERVEGKQKLIGKSGMKWTVDGKGVRTDTGAIVVVECRRYTNSKLKPEAMGGLAYRIEDVGASGGIVVTPIGVQEGGQLIAKSADIQIVHLDADSTTTNYILKFLGSVIIGVSPARMTVVTFAPEVKITEPAPPSND
jgi:hypothetical protein